MGGHFGIVGSGSGGTTYSGRGQRGGGVIGHEADLRLLAQSGLHSLSFFGFTKWLEFFGERGQFLTQSVFGLQGDSIAGGGHPSYED